jgi:hypothetical protein
LEHHPTRKWADFPAVSRHENAGRIDTEGVAHIGGFVALVLPSPYGHRRLSCIVQPAGCLTADGSFTRPLRGLSRMKGNGAPWYARSELPLEGAGVQGKVTPRRPPDLDPKGRGDKSMVGKRGVAEDGYGAALQRLRDMVRAGLPEPQCPVVELHTRREHVCHPTPSRATG